MAAGRTCRWSDYTNLVPDELPARHNHTAVMLGDNLVIFGGLGDKGEQLEDMWMFNTKKNVWCKMESQSAVPVGPVNEVGHQQEGRMSKSTTARKLTSKKSSNAKPYSSKGSTKMKKT